MIVLTCPICTKRMTKIVKRDRYETSDYGVVRNWSLYDCRACHTQITLEVPIEAMPAQPRVSRKAA